MAKAEWGIKRSCPKCGARFYDLGKDNPITCIECGHEWLAEPILKSKQPIPEPEKKKPPKSDKKRDDQVNGDEDSDDEEEGLGLDLEDDLDEDLDDGDLDEDADDVLDPGLDEDDGSGT